MIPKSPCYKCQKRTSDCHCYCEDYKQFHEDNKAALAERRRQAEVKDILFSGIERRKR